VVAAVRQAQATVSNYLAFLRHQGAVEARRAGKQVFYRVASPLVAEVLRAAVEG
jgi:hypothetical protein